MRFLRLIVWCVALLLVAGCAQVRQGWQLPFDRAVTTEEAPSPVQRRLLYGASEQEYAAWLREQQLPLWTELAIHPVYDAGRTPPVPRKIIIVPPGGTPVNDAFAAVADVPVSSEILSLGQEGILALADGDEFLCISYQRGKTEWFAIFAHFTAGETKLSLRDPAIFANRARCVERYKNRRANEVSVRQMDWVIDRLDYLNEEFVRGAVEQKK